MTKECTLQITLEYNPKVTDPDALSVILQEILDAHEICCDVTIVTEPLPKP